MHAYSKATGIQFLADRFGLSLDDCYVIGDSMNDLPMLDYVQHSILMGNGTPSLRSHVEYVTTDILDDGIENALVHYNPYPMIKARKQKLPGCLLKEQFIKHVSTQRRMFSSFASVTALRKAAVRHNNAYHAMIKIASTINFLHSAHPNWISIIFALKCPAHSILFCKYINAIISCCWCQFYILVSFRR